MTSILFVCSGNIFRSLVAEYALKAQFGSRVGYLIGSAGIEALPQEIHLVVLAGLREKGVDPSRHRQRKLTRDLIEETAVVIAMGRNHQAWIRGEFAREVPLFNHICYGIDQPILDVMRSSLTGGNNRINRRIICVSSSTTSGAEFPICSIVSPPCNP